MKSLKSLVFIFTLLFLTPLLRAQTEADSLELLVLRDSLIEVINQGADQEAIPLGASLLAKAKEKEFPFFMIEAHLHMGRAYNFMGKADTSRWSYKRAIAIAEEQGMYGSMCSNTSSIGITFFQDGTYDSAVYYFKKAADIARELVPERLAISLGNVAWIYGVMDDRENEFEAYLASKQALDEIPNSIRKDAVKSMTLGGIGDYYVWSGEYDKARENFEQKLQLGKEIDNLRVQYEAHAGLGTLYRTDEYYDFEKSKGHYEIPAADDDRKNRHYKYQATQGLAKLYRKEGRYEQALVYFRQVYDYYTSNKVNDFASAAATAMGELYLERNQLTEADRWLNIALDATRQANLIARERDALRSMYKVDSLKGRYRSALARFQRMNLINDSLSNERSRNRIKELEIQYETEQTEKENLTLKSDLELKQAQMERQQLIQVFVVVVAVAFIVLALVVYRNYQRKKTDNEIIGQQADELKTLSRFKEGLTSMVVHDMRNPLNAILGFSQGTPTDEKLRNINRSGHQVLNLVNNMLDIQRFEETKVDLNPEILDAKELVTLCIQEITLLSASKSLKVINRVPTSLRFRADPVLVNRILVNLLINAVKYSKSGTEIVIQAGKGDEGFQQLVVRDQGHGIPADQLPHIFEKFWHNDPEKSGVLPSTGLGLSFCKMAIEAHGGEIYAESILHEGTSIFLSLPLAEGSSAIERVEEEQPIQEVNLSANDLDVYSEYLPQLEQLAVFEVSQINKLIKVMEERVSNKNIGRQLRTAAFQGDQSLYDRLLNLIREKNLA